MKKTEFGTIDHEFPKDIVDAFNKSTKHFIAEFDGKNKITLFHNLFIDRDDKEKFVKVKVTIEKIYESDWY